MNKNKQQKNININVDHAIKKFEKMFKEIDIKLDKNNDGRSEKKHLDWIISGNNSATKSFI